jgi:hypothetical protein
MRNDPKAINDDLRRLKRVCLEWAEASTLDLAREAYRSLAGNYCAAAAALEREPGKAFAHGLPTRALGAISEICRKSLIIW